jgi:hypothetical protein
MLFRGLDNTTKLSNQTRKRELVDGKSRLNVILLRLSFVRVAALRELFRARVPRAKLHRD